MADLDTITPAEIAAHIDSILQRGIGYADAVKLLREIRDQLRQAERRYPGHPY